MFILMYVLAVVSILLFISGFVLLILGLINKKKCMIIPGSIMVFFAILIIVFGVFWGIRGTARFGYKCKKELIMINESGSINKQHHRCYMHSLMMNADSSKGNDSMKVCIERKMNCNYMKSCNPKNCNPANCKSKCPNHQ